MAICDYCAMDFPNYTGNICCKCSKLRSAASDTERAAIDKEPQCHSCSVVFPFMKAEICGRCIQLTKSTTSNDSPSTATQNVSSTTMGILERGIEIHTGASKHRLNQPTSSRQNPNLQVASLRKQALSTLKKQSKADTIEVTAMLYYFPIKGGVAKKVQLLSNSMRWDAEKCTNDVLQAIIQDREKAYLDIPQGHRSDTIVLNFHQVKYGISKSGKKADSFEPTTDNLTGSIENLFHFLVKEKRLSESDIKSRCISLHLFAYEARVNYSDDEDVQQVPAPMTELKSRKRQLSLSSSMGPGRYESSYRPQKSNTRTISGNEKSDLTEYQEFLFTKTTFVTENDGTTNEKIHGSKESTIKIAKDWQKNIGDVPKNGYIAKGFNKFVFKGMYKGKKYAIFQCKKQRVTSSQNLIDLTSEMSQLSKGQYFAESFSRRAAIYGVDIPAIRWNYKGSFLGTVSSDLLGPSLEGGSNSESNSQPLVFDTFMASALLPPSPLYLERKFSGSNEAGRNVDDVGQAIDAFAHHTLVDSHGSYLMTDLQGYVGPDKEVILFDPQAHSLEGDTGFGDEGRTGIMTWIGHHKCNTVCRKLKLKDAKLDLLDDNSGASGSGPLRIGWPSPKKPLSP